MKRIIAAACTASFILVAAPAGATAPSHDSHATHGSAGATSRLTFDHGAKWPTDPVLREHMGGIRSALAPHSRAILSGNLTEAQAASIGAAIEGRVASIVADCKLPPEADANLHLVVADLLEAAEVLQGRTRKKPQSGTALAVRATQMYATYFDHPGWKPVH